MAFTFYTDPGHGWIQVDVDTLIDLGIHTRISGYSYINGTTAYLEEDCDAAVFMQAYQDKHGSKPEIVERYSEHTFIRGLPSYGMASY
jgi:hypothetical protein|tara:strand:- start:1096 stop:1359 length:264 start_codon:yes stop_codon:yes gene_type:complete